MGSPVSVVVANLVMEDIEDSALSSFSPPPVFWKRYIMSTMTVVPSDVIPFLQHLNSTHPSIQFTHEMEKSDLPFLDILLKRLDDGSLSTFVYRKSQHIIILHTDRYQGFDSQMHKASVVKTLQQSRKFLLVLYVNPRCACAARVSATKSDTNRFSATLAS